MNAQQFNRLLQEPELLAQTDPEELLHLTGDYPWFGAAQVLSAVQLQHRNEEAFVNAGTKSTSLCAKSFMVAVYHPETQRCRFR